MMRALQHFFTKLLSPAPAKEQSPADLIEFERARQELDRSIDQFDSMVRDMQTPRPRRKKKAKPS